MLRIRNEQFGAFRQSSAESFVDAALTHLLTHYPGPSQVLGGPEQVRAFVERGIPRARQYRIETKGAVIALLVLWIQFGENFERSPLRKLAGNILAHPDLPGEVKVESIRERHDQLTGGCVLIPF